MMSGGRAATGGWSPIAFPDQAASEDFWGIVTDRTPRLLYNVLTNKFVPDYIPPPEPTTRFYRAESIYEIHVRLWENGALLYDGRGTSIDGGRGFNIAAIDIASGRLLAPVQRFDTHASRSSGEAMTSMHVFLESVPTGALLLIAIGDEAGLNDFEPNQCSLLGDPWVNSGYPWVGASLAQLEYLGSTLIRQYCYRDQWALITVKDQGEALDEALGAGTNDAITQATVPPGC